MIRTYDHNANLNTPIYIRTSSKIYVVRLLSTDNGSKYKFGISKPCLNCQLNLYKFNVKRIYYTDIIDGIDVLCELRMNIL